MSVMIYVDLNDVGVELIHPINTGRKKHVQRSSMKIHAVAILSSRHPISFRLVNKGVTLAYTASVVKFEDVLPEVERCAKRVFSGQRSVNILIDRREV